MTPEEMGMETSEASLAQMEGFLRREADKDFADGPTHGLPPHRALAVIEALRRARAALAIVAAWLREDGVTEPSEFHASLCGYCDVKRAVFAAEPENTR